MFEETPKASRSKKNDGYQCEVCRLPFASKRTLNYHQAKAGHLETPLYCDICGLSLKSNMALMVHKKFHVWEKNTAEQQHLSPVYECAVCDHQTRSPRSLVFHYQDIHPSYNRLTNTKSSKRKLISRDENQNEILTCIDFECDLLINKVKCPVCCVSYAENRIRGHLMTVHPFHKRLFCTHCAAIVEDEEEMVAHLMKHSQGRDLHMCDLCECLYISAEALATHQRLHTSQRPFYCSVCKKEFQSKTAAIAHFHSHLKIETLRDSDENTPSRKDENYALFQADVNAVTPQRNLNVIPQDLNVQTFKKDNVELTIEQWDNRCLIAMEDSEDFVNVWD